MSRVKIFCASLVCVLLADCSEQTHGETKTATGSVFDSASTLLSRSGYDYAPSIIRDSDLEQYWWCGAGRAPGSQRNSDVIYHRVMNVATNTWITPTRAVLWPTPGSWDQVHICDPAVVRGQFVNPDDGVKYTYALYYTATEDEPGNNDIGVAFSNDGINWVKFSKNPIVSPQASGTGTYGAGQPAVVNYDKQSGIFMFHTDTSIAGNRMYIRRSIDGINFGAPTRIPLLGKSGGMANSDFAYDPSSGLYYAAIALTGRPGDRETYRFGLYTIPASDLLQGTGAWTELGIVDTNLTGWYLNHSPGIRRNGYGEIDNWLPNVRILFGAGDNSPSTWDLRQIERNPGR